MRYQLVKTDEHAEHGGALLEDTQAINLSDNIRCQVIVKNE